MRLNWAFVSMLVQTSEVAHKSFLSDEMKITQPPYDCAQNVKYLVIF